jgi:hypothetical protein
MLSALIRGMESSLGRWKAKDQPASAHINVGKVQNVATKRSIDVCILAVDYDVSTTEHLSNPIS